MSLSLGCRFFLVAGFWWTFVAAIARGEGLSISSPAFADSQPMRERFARALGNVSPPLQTSGVPHNAKSLVLIVDDPDAPAGLWTHWLVWNIAPGTGRIDEGKVPTDALQGRNSFGAVRYDGPQPPSGTHRYFFHLAALETTLALPPGADRSSLERAMAGHVIARAECHGTYSAKS
jgi:Raf kinase inhibitor-like YbhB/YbcL family protein